MELQYYSDVVSLLRTGKGAIFSELLLTRCQETRLIIIAKVIKIVFNTVEH